MLGTDEIDVVSALAAISSLHDLALETEADADAEDENEADALVLDETTDEAESSAVDRAESEADEEYAVYSELESARSDFPHPPLSVLHRGQIASIVPAAFLIGSGALLTVILTTSEDATLPVPLVIAAAVSGLGLALVTYWLSSARWATGSFFVGMMFLLLGGTAAYLVLPNNLDLVQGWPLLLTAIGTAFVLTDLMNPSTRRLWLVGLILAMGGFAGLLITGQVLDASIIQTIRGFWPVAIGVVAILLIVPFFRRNGQ
jgi:hypothetical protein